MKFSAMHIANQKCSFYIFTVGNLQDIFMEHDPYLISWWFDTYSVFLAIATNYPSDLRLVLLSRATFDQHLPIWLIITNSETKIMCIKELIIQLSSSF